MVRLAERFILEREIGSGGMSRVFLGRDEVLDRPVAVKLLKPGFGETDIALRFRREGRMAARLSHPNIVQVYDAGEGEFEGREVSYIVMEYISGGDLKKLMDERGVLSGADLARLSGVAAGLAHAHERGIIHRDIKPHNILITDSGDVKVADFGIARALDATQATRTGAYLGTALYSSPEQLQGQTVTPKSDVYSLGATLYHAATGHPPFTGTPIEVASQHLSREPTPPRVLNDAVSASLGALILACLSKNPEDRPDADELRLGLLEAGQGVHATRAYAEPPAESSDPSPAAPDPAQGRTGERARSGRRPWAAVALAAVLVAIGALAAFSLLGGDDERAGRGQNDGANSAAKPAGGGAAPGSESPQRSAPQRGETTATRPEATERAGGNLTEEAAVRTVREIYATAADEDYEASYAMLSDGFKQREAPTQAAWSTQFGTLEQISFERGPNAQVSGNRATVTGTTRAVHSDRTELNVVTWTLVSDGDEWKLESISIQSQAIV